mgnify:CR=1 FL=1
METIKELNASRESQALEKAVNKVTEALKNEPLGLQISQIMTICQLSNKTVHKVLDEIKAHQTEGVWFLVEKNQVLARLDIKELNTKLQEAIAYKQQAIENKNYALAIVEEKQSELSLAKKNYDRANSLYKTKSIPLAEFQKNETLLQTAQAVLSASKSQVISAQSTINATIAQIETIKVNIEDSKLYSPVKGRVLYKIAENGEIVANGGKVLVVLDLMNTYMTIFLPTSQAGLVDIGSEARIVLDAIPNIAIPAHVTFVSPLAQFTPKEIETQAEREKLMFRIKVKIDSNVLEKYFDRIKTGLPGVAYIKLDKNVSWPDYLNNLPKKVSE